VTGASVRACGRRAGGWGGTGAAGEFRRLPGSAEADEPATTRREIRRWETGRSPHRRSPRRTAAGRETTGGGSCGAGGLGGVRGTDRGGVGGARRCHASVSRIVVTHRCQATVGNSVTLAFWQGYAKVGCPAAWAVGPWSKLVSRRNERA
jgi:hypothetical protein